MAKLTMLTSKADDPWFTCLQSSDRAHSRLVCFPYAGGSPAVFASWRQHLPDNVELWVVHYPGRGSRFNERPFNRLTPLVEELAPRINHLSDKPLFFFGHSLGALVAFESGRMMERMKLRGPARLFVSSCPAPHMLPSGPPVHSLPAEKLLGALRDLGGLPEEIVENDELLRLMLPVLRADMAMLETYRYTDKSILPVPITALGGIQDPSTSYGQLAAWKIHTAAGFHQVMLQGSHFYVHEHAKDVISEICRVGSQERTIDEN